MTPKLPDIPPPIDELVEIVDWNIGQLLRRSVKARIEEVIRLNNVISEIRKEFKDEILKYNN